MTPVQLVDPGLVLWHPAYAIITCVPLGISGCLQGGSYGSCLRNAAIWVFQLCCVTNKAAVSVSVQRFVWIWTLGKELKVEWPGYIVALYSVKF